MCKFQVNIFLHKLFFVLHTKRGAFCYGLSLVLWHKSKIPMLRIALRVRLRRIRASDKYWRMMAIVVSLSMTHGGSRRFAQYDAWWRTFPLRWQKRYKRLAREVDFSIDEETSARVSGAYSHMWPNPSRAVIRCISENIQARSRDVDLSQD